MIWFAGAVVAAWLLAALVEYLVARHAAPRAVPVPAHASRAWPRTL